MTRSRFPITAPPASTAIIEALKKAGKIDRHALQEALSTLDITTPTGSRVTFKNPPSGENLTPRLISRR